MTGDLHDRDDLEPDAEGFPRQSCPECLEHPGWSTGDQLRRGGTEDYCPFCLGSGLWPTMDEICGCEHIDHDRGRCHPMHRARAGRRRAMHVGAICNHCAVGHMADYLLEDVAV